MTARNTLKRLIRARMQKTDESYSTARQIILQNAESHTFGDAETAIDKLRVTLAQPSSRTGDFEIDIDALFDGQDFPDCDVLVLPELIGGTADSKLYESLIRDLATRLKCHVVGGSCYIPSDQALINSGIVINERGVIVSRYEKVRPYGSELETGVAAGKKFGRFNIGGRWFAVLICSDLWFSDSLSGLNERPDTLLIPSFSITQRDNPKKARELWKHMLISRAYEYTAYIGVSDWAHPCRFDGLPAAGVTGFANPSPNGDFFYTTNTEQKFRSYELDYTKLDSFRANREVRGFL